MPSVVSFQASANSQRSSWAREVRQHDEQRRQMDQERLSWQDEIREHANDSLRMGLDRARWDHERDLWTIERKQWAEEQRQRNLHRPFWGPPQRVSDRCLTYGTREYTAKLYNILTTEDWADKCAKTAIEIKGRTHASPLRCEDHGSDEGIHGYWLVKYDELECEPAWEKFWRGDCDHLPGHRRWESLLWNIHPGDDVYELCRSTPVTLPTGHYFATAKCEDRRASSNSGPRDWRGWLGKWDVPDSTCND
ncbi:hypothetical protein PENSPDRAFT_681289 [Peniophora sp. CONT]|nr:hypothetical protein PENSPDRAFT_681289 [Peniophora sp. CONT]